MRRMGLVVLLGGILAALLLTGCDAIPGRNGTSSPTGSAVQSTKTPAENPVATAAAEQVSVKVYFAARDAQHIVAETHKVKKDSLLLLHAMEILAAGPKNSSLLAVVPPGTRVKSVQVIDRTAVVDFSAEMIKKGFGGSSMEILTVGSIVNTLTEFPEVERVQILVEGKKVTTLFGHLDVSDPLSRSPGIIQTR